MTRCGVAARRPASGTGLRGPIGRVGQLPEHETAQDGLDQQVATMPPDVLAPVDPAVRARRALVGRDAGAGTDEPGGGCRASRRRDAGGPDAGGARSGAGASPSTGSARARPPLTWTRGGGVTGARRQQVREIVESVLRALHRHVTADKPMSIKDCHRVFRLVERTLGLERTLVAEARVDESRSGEARVCRDPAPQPSSTT